MVGYWKRPEETAKTLRGGWLHTGDAGKIDEDGYVFIVDRTKERLSPTDVGIVHFRRAMLDGVRALRDGKAPAAAGNPDAYRLRSGGAVESGKLSFEQMMQQRFGSTTGRVI